MRNKNTTNKIRPQYEGDRHASPLKFHGTQPEASECHS